MWQLNIAPEVVLSIAILVAGWSFTVWFYFWEEGKRIKSRTKYFSKSLEEVLPNIISQSKSYNKVVDDISHINKFRYSLGVVTGLNFHFFNPQIIEDLHSFLSKKKVSDPHIIIKEITDAVNGIEVHFQNFKYNYREFKELQETNYERWNQGINNILSEYDKLFEEDVKKNESTNLVIEIRQTISKLQEIEGFNVEKIHSDFAIPLLKICQKSNCIRSLSIKREVHTVIFNFENLVDNITHFSSIFKRDSEKTDKYHGILKGRLSEINELL